MRMTDKKMTEENHVEILLKPLRRKKKETLLEQSLIWLLHVNSCKVRNLRMRVTYYSAF